MAVIGILLSFCLVMAIVGISVTIVFGMVYIIHWLTDV